MLAGIREILVITTPEDAQLYRDLLGNGQDWGIDLDYAEQPKPEGLAHACLIAEKFIGNSRVCLILGDNIFYGNRIEETLKKAVDQSSDANIFAYYVNDPGRYGVVVLDQNKTAIDLEEKPIYPKSHYAVTGIYMYNSEVVEVAKTIKPSARGELEITDINKVYLDRGSLNVELFDRGTAWLDTGTTQSLLDAANFIRVLEERQGLKIGCPEETAWRQGFIDDEQLKELSKRFANGSYGEYLRSLLHEER